MSIDPLAHDYPELTTYQFASNSPIWGIDLDGLEILKFQLIEKDGSTQLKPNGVTLGFETTVGYKVHPLTYQVAYKGESYSFNNTDDLKAFVMGDHTGYATDNQKANEQIELMLVMSSQAYGEALNDAANAALSKDGIDMGYDPPLMYKQQSSSNKGVKSNGEKSSGPKEPYNRQKHYGKTPTQADRKTFGAKKGEVLDHQTPLVQHYYEGDGKGGKSGWLMTDKERKDWAKDRSRMKIQDEKDSHKQGGKMSQYSKQKKKENGL